MSTHEDLREINRTMWSYGEYRHVADLLRPGAIELIDQLDLSPPLRHLDVATGNGNVGLLTATRGAEVHGLDPQPRRSSTRLPLPGSSRGGTPIRPHHQQQLMDAEAARQMLESILLALRALVESPTTEIRALNLLPGSGGQALFSTGEGI